MKKITWNSPVILGFALLSGIALIANLLTNGRANQLFFSVYRSSFSDPLAYLRMVTHVLGHASVQHYSNNMLIFLLIGPLLEEKYGSKKLLLVIVLVALVTSIVHLLFNANTALLGASGVVFAFILLASITGSTKENEIPLTFIIVTLLYIGEQIYEVFFLRDNVSQLTHIVGGVVGALVGLYLRKDKS
ncbi:MAG: rhomboid family intramembrane serine protease [Solobacterium sp.]|nr:rhomboid family intramembrane serine protease [Solobacterium sp.]